MCVFLFDTSQPTQSKASITGKGHIKWTGCCLDPWSNSSSVLYNLVLYLYSFILVTHNLLNPAWMLKSLKFNARAWHKIIKIMAKGRAQLLAIQIMLWFWREPWNWSIQFNRKSWLIISKVYHKINVSAEAVWPPKRPELGGIIDGFGK